MEADVLYNKVREKRGKPLVMIKAIEEMGELTQCLSRFLGSEPETIPHLQEEIADVTIMMEQLRLMFFSGDIDRIRKEKLARLEEREKTW